MHECKFVAQMGFASRATHIFRDAKAALKNIATLKRMSIAFLLYGEGGVLIEENDLLALANGAIRSF